MFELKSWCDFFSFQSLIPRNEKTEYPMFLFCEGSRNDVCRQAKKREVQSNRLYSMSSSGKETCEDANLYESEEFEIVPNWTCGCYGYCTYKKKNEKSRISKHGEFEDLVIDSFWRLPCSVSDFIVSFFGIAKRMLDLFNWKTCDIFD